MPEGGSGFWLFDIQGWKASFAGIGRWFSSVFPGKNNQSRLNEGSSYGDNGHTYVPFDNPFQSQDESQSSDSKQGDYRLKVDRATLYIYSEMYGASEIGENYDYIRTGSSDYKTVQKRLNIIFNHISRNAPSCDNLLGVFGEYMDSGLENMSRKEINQLNSLLRDLIDVKGYFNVDTRAGEINGYK